MSKRIRDLKRKLEEFREFQERTLGNFPMVIIDILKAILDELEEMRSELDHLYDYLGLEY